MHQHCRALWPNAASGAEGNCITWIDEAYVSQAPSFSLPCSSDEYMTTSYMIFPSLRINPHRSHEGENSQSGEQEMDQILPRISCQLAVDHDDAISVTFRCDADAVWLRRCTLHFSTRSLKHLVRGSWTLCHQDIDTLLSVVPPHPIEAVYYADERQRCLLDLFLPCSSRL